MRKQSNQDEDDNKVRKCIIRILDKCLLALQSKNKKLTRAVIEKNIPKIHKYILSGADTNYTPKFGIPFVRGDSFLHYLAQTAKTDEELKLIETFIKHGADVNKRNCINQTPLHNACIGANHKVAALLLLHGAEINAQDDNGKTPLHLTMSKQDTSTIQLLIHFKANTDLTDRYGKKPDECIKKQPLAQKVKNMINTIKISNHSYSNLFNLHAMERFAMTNSNAHIVTRHKRQINSLRIKSNQRGRI